MSQENVEIVRSIYAAWSRGEFGLSDWAHPEIECVRADGPDPGSWTGVAGMADAWSEFMGAWEGYRIDVEGYRELDGGRVLAFTRRSGRGHTSGLEIGHAAAKGATLWEVRNGLVTRQVTYWDRDRALDDLGLLE
jgi:ketosteroid isomerase-like protein